MTVSYDAQLREIADAVTLVEPGVARVTALDASVRDVPIANERGPFLGLAEALYGTRYNPLRTASVDAAADVDPVAFLAALRSANTLPHRFVQGVAVQREMITAPSGHYVLLGRPVHDARTGRQVRLYWNFGAEGGTTFVRETATRFERARIPFQAKLPVVPFGFARADTGVLYLSDDDVELATDLVRDVYAALGPAIRPGVPMFTLPLAPGLAFAESPPTGDSFGMHRCDLIAEGIAGAYRSSSAPDADERHAAVRRRLIEYGLDVERPAFNPASKYPYRFGGLAAERAA